MKYCLLFILLIFTTVLSGQQFKTNQGKVDFVSEAPLELIEASSNLLQGIVDLEKKTFAFKIYIKSFEGFNNHLQKVHFYENYMEADKFPLAVFKGKILEPILAGKNKYRAKGLLEIHGQSVERIINVELEIFENLINYSCTFQVPLRDHDIKLPRIVYQKIAEIIVVTTEGAMHSK